ncbi:MAG: metallophosphoesterase [Spirosoma sp.]|nr:metallophosphoesterase [Spirosoma sp.]
MFHVKPLIMKLLTISDIHGRTIWKEANFSAFDRIVFLGDYTDSYSIDDNTIYNNLNEIIQFKLQEPLKFKLLIGNHDAQYLHFPSYRCSGFRSWAQPALSTLFGQHASLFDIAHQEGSYLFTHAGVSNQWFARLLAKTQQTEQTITPDYAVAALLNEVHQQPPKVRDLLFEVGPKRGGTDPFSGPVWADRAETRHDYLRGFHQVVGHTPIGDFTTYGDKAGSLQTGSITYTDVLQTQTRFYELNIPD